MAALNRFSKEKLRELAGQKNPMTLTLDSGETVSLVPLEHIDTVLKGHDGWAVASQFSTIVGLDTRVSESLKHEGWAREIVRHVQELRKTADLEMEDRIELSLQTESPELRKAIEAQKDYICRETLAVNFMMEPLGGEVHRAEVKVEGQALKIELRKTESQAATLRVLEHFLP